jgi:hypothetical protein
VDYVGCRHIVNWPVIVWSNHMNMRATDYSVFTSRQGEKHPERWSWEIRRKSKPLGVKLTGDGYQSEAAAQFAGRRALTELLAGLAKEERRRRS